MDKLHGFYEYMLASTAAGLQLFAICAAIFIPLAIFFPNRKNQPLLHKGMLTDAFYWFLASPIIGRPLGVLASIVIANGVLYAGIYSYDTLYHARNGLPPFSTMPVLLQALLILLFMDIIQYWTHRMFHTHHFWKFHAIHHSPKDVDWMTSVRFHPINIFIHSSCVYSIVFLLGFSPEAWAILTPFNAIYSPLVHANLNWTYGPFRYVLASPVFHRWHHTYIEEGGNKNFAPTFPFLDILFGTYYDPKDKRPEIFGTPHDDVSENVLKQLIYPFRRPSHKS